jgi:Family of unknown function (DUF6152)
LRNKISAVLIAFTLLFTVGSLWAHHSPSAIFDMSKPFTLVGTLTRVDWVNPHIIFFFEAKKNDSSTEQWKFESNPPSWFRRVGVGRNDFAKGIGQNVTVEVVRARDGSLYAYLEKITFQDGSSLELVNPSAPETPAKESKP